MSFRLVPIAVTLSLNGIIVVTLHYFTELDKRVSTHNRVDLWWNLCTSLLYFVVRVRCRHEESSRSLSHLLMSFLLIIIILLITLPSTIT